MKRSMLILIIAMAAGKCIAELPPTRLYNSKDSSRRYYHEKRMRDDYRKEKAEKEKEKAQVVYSEYYIQKLHAEICAFKKMIVAERKVHKEQIKKLKAKNNALRKIVGKEADDQKNTLTKIVIVIESDLTVKKGK